MNFTAFKNDFYGRIKDFSVFDCMDFNVLKVVLDGLKVDYVGKGNKHLPLFSFYGKTLHRLKSIIYKIRRKPSRQIENQFQGKSYDYLLLDVGRSLSTEKGERVITYLHNIQHYFDENKVSYLTVEEFKTHKEVKHDIKLPDFQEDWKHQPFTQAENELIDALGKKYEELKQLSIFTEKELANIYFSFVKFIYQYKFWSYFLSIINIKKIIFVCHYHKEGFILACKRKGIQLIELQHGLIAPEDIFYLFPKTIQPIATKALFADKIMVYGDFWKERLLQGGEYAANQIVNLGYYQYFNASFTVEQKNALSNLIGRQPIILITTQTYMHEYFMGYIQFLSKSLLDRNLPHQIIVKNHPAEKKEVYQSVMNLENVTFSDANIDALFTISDYHVSIYSTTLYDAMRYKVKNFALWYEPFQDYVESVVESGVAQKLMPNENVLDKVQTETEINPTYYYHEPDFSLLLK